MPTAIQRYFTETLALAKTAEETNAEALETAARIIEERLAAGGMLHAFGTGHGHLLALEIFYRAGGLVRVNPVLDGPLMLHENASESSHIERTDGLAAKLLEKHPIAAGDVLIVASNSGRNAVPVELAALARERGAFVVALTSRRHTESVTPRNKLGKRLFEVADLVLDNAGIVGDALLPFPDGTRSGATSTAIGSMLLQALVARIHEIACEKGDKLGFFVSANVDGGDAINDRFIAETKAEVPCL